MDGIFVQRHAEAVNRFCNVIVLFAEVNSTQKELIVSQKTVENGVETLRFFYKKRITKIEPIDKVIRLFLYFKSMYLGWNMLSSHIKFDLLHVHVLIRTGIFAKQIKRRFNIPFIITEHWTGFLKADLSWSKNRSVRRVLAQSSAITTVSKPLENALKSLQPNAHFKTIPNVVDVLSFKPTNFKEERNIILHISDLKDDHKNITGLIRTVGKLAEKRSDFELHIVGGGEERQELERLANNLNLLNTKVFFLGELKGDNVISELQKCRFLSLFSNYETFGVVLIEALACGKPVVASRLDCIQEFISDKQGVLVEPKNETQLLEAFEFMLDNFSKYNSEELSQYVNSKFSYDAVGKQFLALYQSILEK